jgi:glycosyltransferase involved in cell wall biosynthesis
MIKINKLLSIILPVKNEGKNLKKIIPILKKFSNDIIVVDGHSNDSTKKICQLEKVKYILDNNIGKGDAQRIGAKNAKNYYLLFFDGDGSHDTKDITKLYKKILKNNLDFIICSRKTGGSLDLTSNISFVGFLRSVGCDFLTLLFNKLFSTQFSDILYSLRIIKKNFFLDLNTRQNGFGIEIEMLALAVIQNANIIEIPSKEYARVFGHSKLKTLTGIYFIFLIMIFFLKKNLYVKIK